MTEQERPAPGTARAPATIGEGCARRFDPQALSDEDGTAFDGAEDLWKRLQEQAQQPSASAKAGSR